MARGFTRVCACMAAGQLRLWRPWRLCVTVALAASFAASLAACATPEQRAAQAQAEAAQMMTIYGPACSRLGYAVQSDAWRNCVIALSTKYDLQHAAPPAGYYGPGYWRDGWWGPYW